MMNAPFFWYAKRKGGVLWGMAGLHALAAALYVRHIDNTKAA